MNHLGACLTMHISHPNIYKISGAALLSAMSTSKRTTRVPFLGVRISCRRPPSHLMLLAWCCVAVTALLCLSTYLMNDSLKMDPSTQITMVYYPKNS